MYLLVSIADKWLKYSWMFLFKIKNKSIVHYTMIISLWIRFFCSYAFMINFITCSKKYYFEYHCEYSMHTGLFSTRVIFALLHFDKRFHLVYTSVQRQLWLKRYIMRHCNSPCLKFTWWKRVLKGWK